MSDNEGQVVSTVLQNPGARIKTTIGGVEIEIFQMSAAAAVDEFEAALEAVEKAKAARKATRRD